ncbi:aldo/keto reductase [Cereibacter sphaeroides]|uniref:aldo/keto reductase n=1 Tax=Cereibacter sphaeroides TaxID=1063 RepID=UPI000191C23C|nr:aldo/keto reductase [Cereibacter sphaeroides]ACM01617.1 Aldo/keto reductase [Cereibacter sphaeroides KD131]AZB63213.1 aldo/keto reductase [Cereibacter sphaeroides]AZB68870.1 aldo/keto reductase [Cereibacter sphaeroides]MWP39942.1 aldo/keto reductase [Cereibacter sphaeroides]
MKRIPLGRTDLTVSELCLGTMTWGSQNSEAEAHAQIDLALDHGVNFIDTAEMYPTNPVTAETVGGTETIIGRWLAARGGRDRIVLATKITGEGSAAVRGGEPVTPESLRRALEGSLARLGTDHVDLYQIHWPNRGSYHFRKMWAYVPPTGVEAVRDNMLAVLEEAQKLVAEGKVRHFGLSNETVWGAAQWLSLADRHGLPRMATVQNEYSLLCRQFDTDWAELSALEEMPLLAFSPLAAGLLSGKYAGDVTPDGSRRERNATLGGRVTPTVFEAVAGYLGIAARHGLDPCQMALAFCRKRPFPVIPILGATSLDQLRTNLGACDLELSPEVEAEIAAAHRTWPAPY